MQLKNSNNPKQQTLNKLIKLFNAGHMIKIQSQAKKLLKHYSDDPKVLTILAASYHRSGKTKSAVKIYRLITHLDSKSAEAFNNLGVAEFELENLNQAEAAFEKSISLNADLAETYNNLANCYKKNNLQEKAILFYKKAIQINPNFLDAHLNFGELLSEMGEISEAIKIHIKAIKINPNFYMIYFKLGILLSNNKNVSEAIKQFKRSIELQPDFLDGYIKLGLELQGIKKYTEALASFHTALTIQPKHAGVLNNIGLILQHDGRQNEAIEHFKAAISIDSSYSDALNNLGVSYRNLGQLPESLSTFNQAISYNPNSISYYSNKALVLIDLGKLDDALAVYDHALSINPNSPEILMYKGHCLRDLGATEKAIKLYDKALTFSSNPAEIQFSKSLAHILNKDFSKGFSLNLWKWSIPKNKLMLPKTEKLMWNGEENKKIFIWADQGLGDEIMYSSFFSLLDEISKKLIIQCDERLIPLFKRSFGKEIEYVSRTQHVNDNLYDVHFPNSALPHIFINKFYQNTHVSNSYFHASQERALQLRTQILSQGKQKIVGLNWNTASSLSNSHFRNISLAQLAESCANPKIKFISLQYGDVAHEIAALRKKLDIDILEIPNLDCFHDIDGLASAIKACDYVVSIDNATAHMAGALGVETKLLLPFNRDWRWGIEGSTSYWYPSMTLFRQASIGCWKDVLLELKNHLEQ